MSIALRIIKGIFALLFSLLVIFIVGFFIWRIATSNTPKSMENIYPTDKLCELYDSQGEDMRVFRQEQRTITSGEQNSGYFAITDYMIIPDANQIQIVFRYNNSTLRYTAEDYGLDSVPSREDDCYDVTLLASVDLTPENKDDNLGNDEESVRFVRCHGTLVGSEQKNLYNFRRYIFDFDSAELDLDSLLDDGLLLAIYADIYYTGDIDYAKQPYGSLCLYDYISPDIAVELDKKDFEALEK